MKTKNLFQLPVNMKLIFIIPALLLAIAFISSCSAGKKAKTAHSEIAPPPPPPSHGNQKAVEETDGEVPFVVVEQMPAYPGGDAELLKYIGSNTKYPEAAKNSGTQGSVIVRFCITSKGKVSQAKVLKGISPELDAEALRVVSTLPDFEPGMQGGKQVPVWYMAPITFSLAGETQKSASQFEVINNDTIYSYTKDLPKFRGGKDEYSKFRNENLKYDPKLKELGVEGFVTIGVIIEKDGTLSSYKIIHGVSPSLDAEALRVTKLMPAWDPGRENGKPVRFRYMIPYEFLASTHPATEHKEGEPFVVVEEMPMFPGGDSALLSFIGKNTKYPEIAKVNGVQGRVIARFCVTETGGIDRVSILKGVSTELDEEAMRVVKSLPVFKPGKQGGKPVPVWYMVPITFSLSPKSGDGIIAPPPPPPPAPSGYDVIPVFKGGEAAMYKFIDSKIVYPPAAKEKNISGKVSLMMTINTDGSITETNVMPGADPLLAAEASRVVKLLPKWTPGLLEGVPVKVSYPVTVTFKLK